MVSIDFRLKVRHWFRKYRNIFLVVFIAWGVVFLINRYLTLADTKTVPDTTYEPTISIINPSETAPKKVQTTAEKMIDEYVGYCNEGNYQKAFNMLSEDCQKYAFNDSVSDFADYVLTKMITPKKHSIQNYSKYDDYYIYEVKYIDDIITTGLTNQEYMYSTEKIVFIKNKDGSYDMSTGNFIKYDEINNISENNYLKVDIRNRITRYSLETYNVRLTNRTDNIIVIADQLVDSEVQLVLPQEYRNIENTDMDIILAPGESRTFDLTFTKFADDGDTSEGILFGAVRVMEKYKGVDGTDEERQAEVNNAIAKFSVEIPLR